MLQVAASARHSGNAATGLSGDHGKGTTMLLPTALVVSNDGLVLLLQRYDHAATNSLRRCYRRPMDLLQGFLGCCYQRSRRRCSGNTGVAGRRSKPGCYHGGQWLLQWWMGGRRLLRWRESSATRCRGWRPHQSWTRPHRRWTGQRPYVHTAWRWCRDVPVEIEGCGGGCWLFSGVVSVYDQSWDTCHLLAGR